ncbi:hypothetical protein TRFO_42473 [Tritrichomonas foetus]|uniref:Uncharacterized protein n=1 Tax=Tritrichomonas foetus TaxID=1144522 RepID=A0A1J4L0V2_9EUKA|nr:hypothetical protein TRFO_42473 [Tritrichomonas foetus]|eukprot:OHT15588.1 hypothetical protein TRFO_42473 [Tritrichomonas foetus]
MSETKISSLLHSVLSYCERILSELFKSSPYSNQRILIFQKLVEIRILISRFLAIYRWSIRNDPIGIQKNINIINFSELENLRKYFHNNAIKSFAPLKYIKNKMFSIVQAQQELSPLSTTKNVFKGHITNIFETHNFYVIIAHPFYSYSISKKNKDYKLDSLKIHDPWNSLNEEYIKKISSHLYFLIQRRIEFADIDKFLFSICQNLAFKAIIKKVKEYLHIYDCELEYKDSKVYIIFPQSFSPFNRFVIEKGNQTIQLRSMAPLYRPPQDLSNYSETFSKYDNYVKKRELSQMFYKILDPFTLDGEALFHHLHKLLFYTKIKNYWLMLEGNIRSSTFSHFTLFLKCYSSSLYFLHILLTDNYIVFMTITFNMKTGEPEYNYSLDGTIPNDEAIDTIFWSVFCRSVEYLDFSSIFKDHFITLKQPFYLSLENHWHVHFSFSENFYIDKLDDANGPTFHLRSLSDEGDSFNINSFILESLKRSVSNGADKMDNIIDNIFLSSKLYVILMELEYKLSENGYFAKRNQNSIWMPYFGCKFKITTKEYWVLKFQKIDFPFLHAGILRIEGRSIGLRFVDSIFWLIQQIFIINSMAFHTRHTSLLSSECLNIRTVLDYKIKIEMKGLEPLYSKNGYNIFEINGINSPLVECKLCRHEPLVKFANLNDFNNICGAISSGIIPALQFCQMFNSNKWKLIPFPDHDTFFIMYRNKFTLYVRKLYGKNFSIILPKSGFSSLLIVPLIKVLSSQSIRTTRMNTIYVTLDFSDFRLIRDSIETYDDIINTVIFMEIDFFDFVNGRIEAKGRRFFLSKIVVDDNGMLISSASFPSLGDITLKIQNLPEISFVEKSSLLFFVIRLIDFDSKGIINILDLIKVLLIYENLNWKEMLGKWYIDSEKKTFFLSINDYNREITILFNNPQEKTAIVQFFDQTKIFKANGFISYLQKVIDHQPIIDMILEYI